MKNQHNLLELLLVPSMIEAVTFPAQVADPNAQQLQQAKPEQSVKPSFLQEDSVKRTQLKRI
jgi:hypothetical protein